MINKFKREYANEIYEQTLQMIGYEDIEMLKIATSIDDEMFFLNLESANKCYEAIKEKLVYSNELKKSKDIMMERTLVELNGVKFKIKPITLGEEIDFQSDFMYSLIPKTEDGTYSNDDVCSLMTALFTNQSKVDDMVNGIKGLKEKSLISLIKERKQRNKKTYNYEFYKGTHAYGLVKWFEKKASVDGKPIHFYDLERKYELSKLQIHSLLCKFMEISNFPMHLRTMK